MGRPRLHQSARLDETARYNADQAKLEAAETATRAALEEWRRLSAISTKVERDFDAKWNPDFHRAPQPCPVCGRTG